MHINPDTGVPIYALGDIVTKIVLTHQSNVGIEWPIGTKAKVIAYNHKGDYKLLKLGSLEDARWAKMDYWILLEQDISPYTKVLSNNKINNDERDTCYACGSLTRIVDTGCPGPIMRVCTVCKK